MNILIVYCHPSERSYTFQVFAQLRDEFALRDWQVVTSDLYAMDFRGDMTEQEYEREGAAKTELPVPPDVLAEHGKIDDADCVVFVYPVWWGDCPAKLKGWFDRVFSAGYAYGQNGGPQAMKTMRYGLALCTAGHPNGSLAETGIAGSMENIMLKDRLGDRFAYKEMVILGGTLQIGQVREHHTAQIKGLAARMEAFRA